MWWDTRKLREPTEILVFDLQTPNEQKIDRAIGVSSSDYEPSVGTKFMFGLENGIVISGSRKSRTPAEKMALRFNAHYGPVLSVDRSGFNPKIFLTVGDCTVRVWAEDTKDNSLVSTRYFFLSFKTKHSKKYLQEYQQKITTTNNYKNVITSVYNIYLRKINYLLLYFIC